MFHITADQLPRFMQCNGSRLMEPLFDIEQGDTEARDEGVAAHYMFRAVLNKEFELEELVDRKAPNGYYMTAKMADYIQGFIEIIIAGETEIETSFEGVGWRIGGRADHIAWDGVDTLHVYDYKHGHSAVEPERNWTLISHAIGHCIRKQIAPARIRFVIHQPRATHYLGETRDCVVTYGQLMELYDELNRTLTNPSDTLQTGALCKRCPARHPCPAATAMGMSALDASEQAFAEHITDEQLSAELVDLQRAKDIINQRLDARQELAVHRIRGGAILKGFGVDNRNGHKRFKKEYSPELLSIALGVDVTKSAIVTPAEAIRRGANEIAVNALTETPSLGYKLVRMNASKRAEKLLKG